MKTYKKFFIKTILVSLFIMLLFIGIIFFIGFRFIGEHVYDGVAANIHFWVDTKNNRAIELNKKGNKIVFLSGSNTLYGLDSKFASEVTGLPVLNYGIHAGFGPYLFENAKNILKNGDIVILPLEFDYYKDDSEWKFSTDYLSYIVSYDKQYFKTVNFSEKFALCIHLIKTFIANPNVKKEQDLLVKEYTSQLNDYDDFYTTNDIDSLFQKNAKNELIFAKFPKLNDNFSLYKFIEYCKTNNIKLYATMPNFYHSKSITKEEYKAFQQIRNFYAKNGVIFIGNIDSGFIKNKKHLYNTSYHTNKAGKKLRTDWIIRNILSIKEIKEINGKV